MKKIFDFIIKHKRIQVSVFIALAVICGIMIPLVKTNYNMVDYLPEDVGSTKALEIMKEEFGGELQNARIMLVNVTFEEVIEIKKEISKIEGVLKVDWIDDMIDLSMLDQLDELGFELDLSMLEAYYKDNTALLGITIKSGLEQPATDAIYTLIGEENAMDGQAPNDASLQDASVDEVINAFIILIPIIIIILILATSSWIEPILYFITIGIAVVINMGTNAFFDDISFVTLTVSPILQLAVSLDYAIFLLNSFNEYKQKIKDKKEAMRMAVRKSIPTVAASAATTVIGFLALIFMRFRLGTDLGLNLVKGVSISFLSVIFFLPPLALLFTNLLDKTLHKPLIPSFKKVSEFLIKIRVPFLILALAIAVPAFIAQSKTDFFYGAGGIAETARPGKDAIRIEEVFGKENKLVLLIPKEEIKSEYTLSRNLSKIPHITGVMSFVTVVGTDIPERHVPESIVSQFRSENYTRIILDTDLLEEGDVTFDTIDKVRDTVGIEGTLIAGPSAALYDMKQTITADMTIVNLIAIIGIFLVLLLTFRSISLPFILVFVIETAIWINLSVAYVSGNNLMFIGYLIISTVQLGATIDYAILLTHNYLHIRPNYDKKEAMKRALSSGIAAILTSGGILASAGFSLALTSTNPVVSEMGLLLGRGTILSFLMVIFVLPALLLLFDKAIIKTTINNKPNNNN